MTQIDLNVLTLDLENQHVYKIKKIYRGCFGLKFRSEMVLKV